MTPDAKRTEQDLLAERRATVNEYRREPDQIARAILWYRVDEIDREIARRGRSWPL